MAAGLTNVFERYILDHILGVAVFTAPSPWYVGLSTTTPDADGANFTEPAGADYERKSVPTADWEAATGAAPAHAANEAGIVFVQAESDWGTITHLGLFRLDVGGAPLVVGALPTPPTVTAGDVVRITAGDLVILLGAPEDTY